MRQLNQAEEAFTIIGSVHLFTLVCVLKLNRGPTEQALKTALGQLQAINPLLKVFIRKEKKHFRFVEDRENRPIPLKMIRRTGDKQWEEVAETELNTMFDHSISPLMRVTYIASDSAKDDSEIIVSFHHAIIDAASFLPLIDKLLFLLGKVESGAGLEETDSLEPVPVSPLLNDVLPKPFRGPRLIFKLLPFMARQMGDESKYKKASKKIKDIPVPGSSENGILQTSFSEEETLGLVKFTRSRRITLNSAITAAMLMAVNKHRYNSKKEMLRAIQFANLRPYLKPPVDEEGAGSFVAMIRSSIGIYPDVELADLAADLDKKFSKSAKRGDKFLYALLSKMLVKSTIKAHKARLGAVALSYAGAIKLKEQYGDISLKGIYASISNNCLGAELTAFGKIYRGCLTLDMNYLLAETSREFAEKLVMEIRFQLLNCIKS